MGDTGLERALQDSVDEVLEKMFFIRSLGEPPSCRSEPEVAAALTFEGDPSGSLTLRVSADAARSVAADFLGVEELELTEKDVAEVVCELANMICGSVLSRVESAATFRLSSPQILPSADVSPPAGITERSVGSCKDHQNPLHTTTKSVAICGGAMVIVIDTENTACLGPKSAS